MCKHLFVQADFGTMTAGVKAGHNGPASSACTLVLLAIALTLTACERQAPPADDTPDPPNILLIFALCESCDSPTPRLDELAREGARLTSFYAPTPYCAPSRATLLTGRYPFRHSLIRNPAPDAGLSDFGLPLEEITVAELLKGAGYKTAMFGKWHLGHRPQWLPSRQGFDEYLSILYSNDMKPVQLVEADQVVEYPVDQAILTQRYTQRAIDFISTHRDVPFFVYLPHAMPHKPLAASKDYYTPETPDDLYADVIRELDGSVGRILDALNELGLDDNTLVIFTSDNGPYYGGSTGGLRGMKGRSWEGGVRVPFIARYPGRITAGSSNDAPAAMVDVLPTIAAYAELALPDDRIIDGYDIRPLFEDSQAQSPHDAIYTMRGSEIATIRMGPWKLHVRDPGTARGSELSREEKENWVDPRGPDGVHIIAPFEQAGPLQHPGVTSGDAGEPMMLFNLEDDPAEQHNVSDAYPDIVARLKQKYDETAQLVPDTAEAASSYLLQDPLPGERRPLMKLLGGDLRYDRVAEDQRHLLREDHE
jgi:uncharacterized sulfatase